MITSDVTRAGMLMPITVPAGVAYAYTRTGAAGSTMVLKEGASNSELQTVSTNPADGQRTNNTGAMLYVAWCCEQYAGDPGVVTVGVV